MEKTPIVLNDSTHTPLMPGETLPPRVIPISTNSGNIITRNDDGLFAPTPEKRARQSSTYALRLAWPDDITAESACGKLGRGVYWKFTNTIRKQSLSPALLSQVSLTCIPCKSDGTPVPYNVIHDYISDTGTGRHGVCYTFAFTEIPTHVRTIYNNKLLQIARGPSESGGLDDIYPESSSATHISCIVWHWQTL